MIIDALALVPLALELLFPQYPLLLLTRLVEILETCALLPGSRDTGAGHCQ